MVKYRIDHPAGVGPAPTPVTMNRAAVPPTPDQALWVVIRNSAEALSFENYAEFIEPIMCGPKSASAQLTKRAQKEFKRINRSVQLTFPDAEPYRLLKVATEVFMMANCGVVIGGGAKPGGKGNVLGEEDYATILENAQFGPLGTFRRSAEEEQLRLLRSPTATPSIQSQWQHAYLQKLTTAGTTPEIIKTIPYLNDIVALELGDVPILQKDAYGARECYGILQRKLTRLCLLELIWNDWPRRACCVQTTNAMSWRFQNRRGPQDRDPLAMVEIDPLRGLNNLLWGWVQDEEHRLTIPRRAYEYDHEYGLKLIGKAVPPIQARIRVPGSWRASTRC